MSGHWEAAVEAAVKNHHSHYVNPNPQTPPWLRQQIEHGLTTALLHLRRHIIAELQEKAEAEHNFADDMSGYEAARAFYAAEWLGEQEADDE